MALVRHEILHQLRQGQLEAQVMSTSMCSNNCLKPFFAAMPQTCHTADAVAFVNTGAEHESIVKDGTMKVETPPSLDKPEMPLNGSEAKVSSGQTSTSCHSVPRFHT
jgi:negative regulator of sigma E activity